MDVEKLKDQQIAIGNHRFGFGYACKINKW